MDTPTRVFVVMIRICGFGAVLLGAAFWLGYARSLTQLHMALGIGVVLSLWILAALAWRDTSQRRLVAFAVFWGLLTWILGLTQTRLLPGSLHWLVQVVHLAVGGVAIMTGGRLANARVEHPTATARSA